MYKPPRPAPLSALSSLVRAVTSGDGNLLNLLPGAAYEMDIGPLGWSRRSTLIVNDPVLDSGVHRGHTTIAGIGKLDIFNAVGNRHTIAQ